MAVVVQNDLASELIALQLIEPSKERATPGTSARWRHEATAEKELAQPMHSSHFVLICIAPGPNQIAESFMFLVGDPDRSEVTGAEQTREVECIATIRLDPIAWAPRNQRRRHHEALDA